jgi:hypothetical protein
MAEDPVPEVPLPERFTSAFQRLQSSAKTLNTATTGFGNVIAFLNSTLEVLNIRVSAWVRIRGNEDDATGDYWHESVGWAKIGRTCGIALRESRGNYHREDDVTNDYFFNDAPPSLRITAVDKLPELIDKLSRSAEKTARKLDEKTAVVEEIVAALKKARVEAAVDKPKTVKVVLPKGKLR